MSQAIPTKCPIELCKFHEKLIYTDKSKIKNHIKHHDYKELQETAFKLGLLEDPQERRSVNWLVDRLTELSIVREEIH